jgi:hypothetical protein
VLTDGGARLGVPRLLKPSRLSEEETVRSVDESRSRCCERGAVSFEDSETLNMTLGEVVRPFLSVETSRATVLTLSADALREGFAFGAWPM